MLKYEVVDHGDAKNNRQFLEDYLAAHEYIQKLSDKIFTKYLTFTTDRYEDKFFFSNDENFSNVRTLELVTTLEGGNHD